MIWSVLLGSTILRGLRFPHPYAKGHWLFHYGFGFVKRGLPGTLIQPWIVEKTAEEIHAVLDALGLVLLIAAFALVLSKTARVLARAPIAVPWWVAVLGTTVFVLSPFVVSESNLCGYFDHLLMVGSIVGLSLIRRGHFAAAGVVGAICVLSHEMFVLFGLPLWCFALWIGGVDEAQQWRRYVPRWLQVLGPGLAITAFIYWGEKTGAFLSAGKEVYEYIKALRAIPPVILENTSHPLRVTVSQNMDSQLPQFLGWLLSEHAVQVVHPTTLAFLFLGAWILTERRNDGKPRFWLELTLMVLVITGPIVIATIGWDWQRFMMMPAFHGWLVVLIVLDARCLRTTPDRGSVRTQGMAVAGLALSAIAIISSVRGEIFFTAPGAGPDHAFEIRRRDAYRCDRPLFPNSNFASGTFENWTLKGQAFWGQPLLSDVAEARGAAASPRGPWVGSYEGGVKPPPKRKGGGRRKKSSGALREPSDRYKGRLRSVPFVVEGDTIVFRVGGGADRKHTYVRLLVAGDEVFRVAGSNVERLVTERWDVARHGGREAVIEIVDDARGGWGHINAEGFCYED